MSLDYIDKVTLVLFLIFWLGGVAVTFDFLENKQTNYLISKCVSETKDHLACKNLYNRK